MDRNEKSGPHRRSSRGSSALRWSCSLIRLTEEGTKLGAYAIPSHCEGMDNVDQVGQVGYSARGNCSLEIIMSPAVWRSGAASTVIMVHKEGVWM